MVIIETESPASEILWGWAQTIVGHSRARNGYRTLAPVFNRWQQSDSSTLTSFSVTPTRCTDQNGSTIIPLATIQTQRAYWAKKTKVVGRMMLNLNLVSYSEASSYWVVRSLSTSRFEGLGPMWQKLVKPSFISQHSATCKWSKRFILLQKIKA